jgi:multicomponent Na+:H+ antiporter subunit D
LSVIALPVLLPLITAIVLLVIRARRAAYVIAACGAVATFASTVVLAVLTWSGRILVLRLGSWRPQLGIVWVADRLAATMLVLSALTSLAMLVYLPASLRDGRERKFLLPQHQFLMVGVHGAFVTGDLFNLFVFFEILLLASFVLVSLGERGEQLRRTYPYVVVNLVASTLFLGGVGAVYATVGTVNLAELARRAAASPPSAFWAAIVLVLVVFAVKTALAPVFVWLPDAYPHAPIAVSALFAGLLTKVGVYTLLRGVPLFLGPTSTRFHQVLVVVSAVTMVVGGLGALGRRNIRAILSFHIVSQVGYMVLGIALLTPLTVAAAIFFVVHQIVAKSALFFAGGIAERIGGSGDLEDVHGLARTHPWVAVGFFVPALALAGMPPLSGFWGKLFLLDAGFRSGAYVATGVALATSLLTLASMLKIWTATFWGAPSGHRAPELGRDRGMLTATLGLASLTVVIGFAAGPLANFTAATATELLQISPYVEAVLGVPEVAS